MNADGALAIFRQVQDLVDGLFEFDFGRQAVGKFECVGLDELAVVSRFIHIDDAKVLAL